MERMTFYVPPVFLFGNNANRVPHDEEKKSEYKTAAETEIKVENWRAKRIAELEEENKNLKEEIKERQEEVERFKSNAMADADYELKLEEENKKLKEDNKRLREGVDAGQKLVEDLISKNKNLEAIIEHYKKFEEGKEKLEGMLMEEDTLQELKDIGEI